MLVSRLVLALPFEGRRRRILLPVRGAGYEPVLLIQQAVPSQRRTQSISINSASASTQAAVGASEQSESGRISRTK
jgi:hypothetical protein